MIACYVLYDHANRPQETFAGPFRLARWTDLPAGWCIEAFHGGVSKGMVSLPDVKLFAEQLRGWFVSEGEGKS